jgi:hypothetical protein
MLERSYNRCGQPTTAPDGEAVELCRFAEHIADMMIADSEEKPATA